MIYKVLSPQSYVMDLGIVGYLDHGQDFETLVKKVIRGLPAISWKAKPAAFTKETLKIGLVNSLWESVEHKAPVILTRQEESFLKVFLKDMHDEYRRWVFTSAMDDSASYNDDAQSDLEALSQLHKHMADTSDSPLLTLCHYVVETFVNDMIDMGWEIFDGVRPTFENSRRGKIKDYTFKVDASNLDWCMVDLKFLINVEGE